MSQTKIKINLKGVELEVMAGWDRPCNHYFANIFYVANEDDDTFYSTMDEPDADMCGGYPKLEDVKTRVEKLVGSLPQEFWDAASIKDMNQVRFIDSK